MHSNDDVYPSGNKVIMGDFNGANVCDSSGRPRQHYPPPPSIHSYYYGHRRTGQHPFGGGGGANRFLPEWIPTVGGGVVAEIFQDP